MNPFQVLGIPEESGIDEIKKAYRKLAVQYHPDKGAGNEDKFREIQAAYELINSEQKLKQYKSRGNGAFVWDSDLETYFKDFFGRMGSTQRHRTVYVTISITLEEAFAGGNKSIQYRIGETCHNCGGVGATTFDRNGRAVAACDKCAGTGSVGNVKQATVTIPRSVNTGTILNADQDDVLVTVQVTPHNLFERVGNTIYSQVTIPLVRAFDNSMITVDTLHGPVQMQVPRCVQQDQNLRLRGKGMFDSRKNAYGDHIIKLTVEIPTLPDEVCDQVVAILNKS